MSLRNYGLDWKYEKGTWGRIRKGKPINFEKQLGIYVLYKKDKLYYVGKSNFGRNPGIFGRLAAHCSDRHKGKWDSFSWFGFYPVENGRLKKVADGVATVKDDIRDMETLLIHLLEPSGNLASGQYRHLQEYAQCVAT